MIDPLSDVLRSVRLTGGIFLESRFTAPWCVMAKLTAADCRPFLERPAQVIAYHFITKGRLFVSVEAGSSIELRAGEAILLPGNDLHLLGSEAGLTPVPAGQLIQPSLNGGLARIDHGGGGEETRVICGFLGSEDSYNPLLDSLPSMLKIDIREGTSRDWIEASVRFAANELAEGRVASSGIVSRLSELLLVEAVREYSSTLKDEVGWLKGLKDPQIGRALSLIHRDLSAHWSADSLAREVALSRSAFMDRFRAQVGLPPIRYLTTWRLRNARLHLRESTKSVAQLAHMVGYASEEAFSRAFKREFGVAPARWRDQQAGNHRAIEPAGEAPLI